MRRRVLREEPTCRRCQVNPSQHVDHIVEIEDGGPVWDRENLQGLCQGCHSSKTALNTKAKRKRSA